VSLVVTLSTEEMIEAAMVGRDGVVGASAALDGRISLSRAIVQIGGHGVSCDVDVLKRAAMESASLHSLLLRHEQVVYGQAQQSAACNITHSIEERLARWLLRARDLSPLRLEAAILSRMRSEVTSRSNWAKDQNTFSVKRPIEVVVLNCWVTDTNETPCLSNSSTSLAKSANDRVKRSTL
jgi:hypothetical protein